MSGALTLFEKIWNAHIVAEEPPAPAILYIDLHLVHEVTSPQAFEGLRRRGLRVRRPERTFATVDHSIPTLPDAKPDPLAEAQIAALERNAAMAEIRLLGRNDARRGIVHIVGPELGLTQPGMTVVCGDSHTSTHGAFGALAFGIGTTEVEQVLATQTILQHRPGTFEVRFEGRLSRGVTAKDAILALLAKGGVAAGTGHVFEYTGEAVRGMDMEERMTLCNMSIEGGARAGMIAPDDVTFQYLAGRGYAPVNFDRAVERWRLLSSDPGARYDRTMTLSLEKLEPMMTFGTNPAMGMPVSGSIPDPARIGDPEERSSLEKALRYMGFAPGERLLGKRVNVVFIGSCTNSRITDLREAAKVMRGRRVDSGVRALVVPGSQEIKRQAESEGLDRIFRSAGAEWREPGCSMCIAMNGDEAAPGEVVVSTSNRNFEGRQGKGSRTILASPASAAAAAVSGVITDARGLA